VASPRKPSLLVFLPDQQRADTITPEYAPNLAKLAQQSVVFERAYVTHPVCTPSRSAIMTGTWPHQNGCTHNSVLLPAKYKCLPQFVDSNYISGYFGKWHLGDDGRAQRGFQHWISTEGTSDYSRYLIEHGQKPDRPDSSFSARSVSRLPIELSKTQFLEKHACDFIEKYGREPFVLFVAFVEPHSPYNGPLNAIHLLPEEVSTPAELRRDTPLRYRLMQEWQEAEAILDRERLPEQYYFGVTPEERRSIRQRYLGLVTQVDQSIGAILETLVNNGVFDETIIVHTSDHGDMLGDHQLFGKEVMFEEAVRVPLIVKMPHQQSATRYSHPISQIDLLPTLVELLGGEQSDQFAGTSRAAVLQETVSTPIDDPVFVEWSPNRTKIKKRSTLGWRWRIRRAANESTRTIICADGWKLSLRKGDVNELYQLNRDPAETTNLFAKPEYTRVIHELTEQVHAWQERTRDPLKL